MYEIDVFNQEDVERLLAKVVSYVFKITDERLIAQGADANTYDNLENFVNRETGEYAVQTWYVDKNDVQHISYIIFSKKGAMEKDLRSYAFDSDLYNVALIDFGAEVGYTFASNRHNDGVNAIVVCIY